MKVHVSQLYLFVAALLSCEGQCFAKGSDEKVELNCTNSGCEIHLANINVCKSNRSVYVICVIKCLPV